jgi:hypothetical protein
MYITLATHMVFLTVTKISETLLATNTNVAMHVIIDGAVTYSLLGQHQQE